MKLPEVYKKCMIENKTFYDRVTQRLERAKNMSEGNYISNEELKLDKDKE